MYVAARAGLTPAILDSVRVSVGKGSKPAALHEYATVGVRDSVLVVTAFDPSVRLARFNLLILTWYTLQMAKHIERAIHGAQLGLAPSAPPDADEGVIHVPIPRYVRAQHRR